MLDQQLREKTRVQPRGILQSVDRRIFRHHPQVESRVSQRQIEIDQQSALARFLGNGYRKIASQRGGAVAALGAEERQQPPARLLGSPRGRTPRRSPDQSLRHRALREGQRQKLPGARTHAVDQQL